MKKTTVFVSLPILIVAGLMGMGLYVYSNTDTVTSSQARQVIYQTVRHPVGRVYQSMDSYVERHGGIKAIRLFQTTYHHTRYGYAASVTGQILARHNFDAKTGMHTVRYTVTVHMLHTVDGWRVTHRKVF